MHWLPAILIIPYLILLTGIYRSLRKIKPVYSESLPSCFVSVVIACRNEQNNLPHLLKCISEQIYPPELYEVIIVDDHSDDKTFDISASFKGECNFNTIRNPGRGKKQALAAGINAASGAIIITTDADCSMGKNWIKTIAGYFEKHNPGMIICPVIIESKPGFFNRFQELEFLSLQGITAGTAFAGKGTMCNGANLAFTRESYANNSGNLHMDLASGDDVFLLHSLKKNKNSVILWLESSEAIVETAASPSLLSYMKQRRRWISKSTSYSDPNTILLGIVTFVTILLTATTSFAWMADYRFLPVFLTIFVLKSIPDFLILKNTAARYGKEKLMRWFFPAQIVYPYYVIAVVVYSFIAPAKRKD